MLELGVNFYVVVLQFLTKKCREYPNTVNIELYFATLGEAD